MQGRDLCMTVWTEIIIHISGCVCCCMISIINFILNRNYTVPTDIWETAWLWFYSVLSSYSNLFQFFNILFNYIWFQLYFNYISFQCIILFLILYYCNTIRPQSKGKERGFLNSKPRRSLSNPVRASWQRRVHFHISVFFLRQVSYNLITLIQLRSLWLPVCHVVCFRNKRMSPLLCHIGLDIICLVTKPSPSLTAVLLRYRVK